MKFADVAFGIAEMLGVPHAKDASSNLSKVSSPTTQAMSFTISEHGYMDQERVYAV